MAGSVETALALGKGVVHVVYPRDDVPEPQVARHHPQPAFCLRSLRAELRAAHAAPFLVQQLVGLVPGLRRLGRADRHQSRGVAPQCGSTLAQGAVALWPDVSSQLFAPMLESFCRGTGIPADVPFGQLDARHRRLIMHGTGEQWYDSIISPRPGERGRG